MISRAHFGIDVDQHAVCGLPLAGMTRDRIARRNMHRKSLWHGQTTGVPLPNPHRTGLDLASSGCGCASQQSFGTEILVDVGPMNSEAAAGNFPVLALRGGGAEQPRIPDERHCDDAAIDQAHTDCVLGELDF